jgi:hypothetical protein
MDLIVTFLIVFVFAALVAAFTILAKRQTRRGVRPGLRPIEGLEALPAAVGESVEGGSRLQLALGSGALGSADTASTLAGLNAAGAIASVAVVGDRPPLITAADGASAVLGYDVLRQAHRDANALDRFDLNAARVIGLSPDSYAAGALVLPRDEKLAGTVLLGSAGPEAALVAEANTRAGLRTVAGADRLTTQAALYAAAEHPVLGEDMFAASAYLTRRASQLASLQAQDIVRILIIVAIVLGVVAKTVGLIP